jgi:hypothetical protein
VCPQVSGGVRLQVTYQQVFIDSQILLLKVYLMLQWKTLLHPFRLDNGSCFLFSPGAITTLGRGGSDLSATVLGAALGLDEVQVWKDVDGELALD